MTPELQEAVNGLVTTVVVGLGSLAAAAVPYALWLARRWVQAKTGFIADERVRAGVDHAMQRLGYIVETVVAHLNQSVKEVGADGKITVEEAAHLRNTAYGMVRQQLPAYMMDSLRSGLADADRYIISKIEAAVLEQKALLRELPLQVRQDPAADQNDKGAPHQAG